MGNGRQRVNMTFRELIARRDRGVPIPKNPNSKKRNF